MSGPLRAYTVTHYAMTEVVVIVAARTREEAVEKARHQEYIDEGWAGEAFPMRARPKARRYPALDGRAALQPEGSAGT